MIAWLKYLPIQLRHDLESTDCRGPNFDDAKPVTLFAGGCAIHLRAPKHKSNCGDPPLYWKKDGMEGPFRTFNSGLVATDNWVSSVMLTRSWSYWKAWFAGTEGELYLSVSVVKRNEEKAFDGVSFFHPKGFEYAIANFLDTRYGYKEYRGTPRYRAPVNWTVHDSLPVFSASFDVKGSNERLYFVFPVSDDAFIQLVVRYSGGGEALRSHMETIAKQIVNSVSVELSPEAQAQWDRVKSECPNMSLSKTFAPLDWPIKPEDIEKDVKLKPSAQSQSNIYDIDIDDDRLWQ